jgi:hypothetical protein
MTTVTAEPLDTPASEEDLAALGRIREEAMKEPSRPLEEVLAELEAEDQ